MIQDEVFTTERLLTRKVFESSPRFGFPGQFADLFSEDDQVVISYVAGVLVLPMILLVFYLGWGIGLLCFKYRCCCWGNHQRLGFLTGESFRPMTPQGKSNMERIFWGRVIFATSCVGYIAFAVVLVAEGIGNMTTANTTVGDGALLAIEYFSKANSIIPEFLWFLAAFQRLRGEMTTDLQSFASALRNSTGLESEGGSSLNDTITLVIGSLTELETDVEGEVRNMHASVTDGQIFSEDVFLTTEDIRLEKFQIGIGVVMTLIPFVLLCFLFLTVYGRSNKDADRFRSWVVLPLFVVMVTVSLLILAGMTIAGILNGDFCSGGENKTPESTIIEIMNNMNISQQSFKFQAIGYMVKGCSYDSLIRETPTHILEDFQSKLNSTFLLAQSLLEEIDAFSIKELSQELGINVTDVRVELQEFRQSGRSGLRTLVVLLNSVACQPIYTIYSTVVHKATCSDSQNGTYTMFICLLIVSFFGLLAISLRSALYPIAIVLEESDGGWDLELVEEHSQVVISQTKDHGASIDCHHTVNNSVDDDTTFSTPNNQQGNNTAFWSTSRSIEPSSNQTIRCNKITSGTFQDEHIIALSRRCPKVSVADRSSLPSRVV